MQVGVQSLSKTSSLAPGVRQLRPVIYYYEFRRRRSHGPSVFCPKLARFHFATGHSSFLRHKFCLASFKPQCTLINLIAPNHVNIRIYICAHTHTHSCRICFWRGLPLPLPSSPGRSPTGVRLPPCDLGRSPRRDHGAYQVTWQARSPTPKANPTIQVILGTGSHSPYQVSLIGVPLANASHLATPNTPPEGIVARTGSRGRHDRPCRELDNNY